VQLTQGWRDVIALPDSVRRRSELTAQATYQTICYADVLARLVILACIYVVVLFFCSKFSLYFCHGLCVCIYLIIYYYVFILFYTNIPQINVILSQYFLTAKSHHPFLAVSNSRNVCFITFGVFFHFFRHVM